MIPIICAAVLHLPAKPTCTVSRCPPCAIHSRSAETPTSRMIEIAVGRVISLWGVLCVRADQTDQRCCHHELVRNLIQSPADQGLAAHGKRLFESKRYRGIACAGRTGSRKAPRAEESFHRRAR